MEIVYLVSLTIIAQITTVLIFCHVYEDGVIGKAALGTLWIISLGVLGDSLQGRSYEPLAVNVVLVAAFALFLSRHFYRWLRYQTSGKFKWAQKE